VNGGRGFTVVDFLFFTLCYL